MRLFIATLAAAGLWLCGAAAQGQRFAGEVCGAKVDVEIKAPPPGVNANLASFLGAWTGGRWGAGLCNGLIVREVTTAGTATVRYVFPPTRDQPLGWFEKADAKLYSTGRLQFKSQMGADVWYQLEPDGSLMGWYNQAGGQQSRALRDRLRRQTLP